MLKQRLYENKDTTNEAEAYSMTLEVDGTLLSHYGIGDGSCLQVVIQVGWIIRVSDLHNPGRVLEVFLKGHNPEVSLNTIH